MPRPMTVASGTLRLGFSMTPADTVALSMPMYAHSAIEAARETACMSEPPLTFQPARKVSVLNQNQPKNAMPRIGISARAIVQVSSAPTARGPRMLANVRIQITAAVANTLAGGPLIPGIN